MQSKQYLLILYQKNREVCNMKIKILDKTTNKTWEETFSSPYFMEKRINKLKYSKKLEVISTERS